MDKNYKDGIIKLVEDVMNRYLKRNLQSLIDDIGIERKMADVHLSVKKFTNEIMDERDSLSQELTRIDHAVGELYTCHPDFKAPHDKYMLPDIIPDFEKRIKKLEDSIERLEK